MIHKYLQSAEAWKAGSIHCLEGRLETGKAVIPPHSPKPMSGALRVLQPRPIPQWKLLDGDCLYQCTLWQNISPDRFGDNSLPVPRGLLAAQLLCAINGSSPCFVPKTIPTSLFGNAERGDNETKDTTELHSSVVEMQWDASFLYPSPCVML